MKEPDEIKKGLRTCASRQTPCNDCPYHFHGCISRLAYQALAYITQLENHIGEVTKMDSPTKAETPDKGSVPSHSERDIVLGCIGLINEVLNGEFAVFEQLEADGFDFDEYKKKSECELGFSLTYFEIVQRLLLYHTSHSGGTSTRAKCRELGFDPSQCVSFYRDRGNEEGDDTDD